jgi:hypothetical protein
MTTKCRTAVGAALVLAGGLAIAAEPSAASRALAEKLLDVMQTQRLMEEQFEAMRKTQLDAFQQLTQAQATSPETKKRAQAVQTEMMKLMKEEFAWKDMEAEFAAAYASTFTEDELRGLIVFYESPVGRAFIAKTPELTERTVAISTARLQALMPRIQRLLMELLPQGGEQDADGGT